jgi:excisionase family DNA binding protein
MQNIANNHRQGSQELIDKKEAAKRLKCTTRHIDNLVSRGDITKIKVGELCRFDWNDVLATLKDGKGQA